MDARERRRGSGPGWLVTLVGASLLVAVGFGIGLVVGATWEDPALVARHVAGRTETVSLAPPEGEEVGGPAPFGEGPADARAESGGAVRRAAESAPSGSRAAGGSARRGASAAAPVEPAGAAPEPSAPAAAPAPAAPEPSRSPAGGQHSVQVGSYTDLGQAEALAERLRGDGYRVYVTRGRVDGIVRWRVRVGPVLRRGEAEDLAARLRRDGLPTWVVSSGAG